MFRSGLQILCLRCLPSYGVVLRKSRIVTAIYKNVDLRNMCISSEQGKKPEDTFGTLCDDSTITIDEPDISLDRSGLRALHETFMCNIRNNKYNDALENLRTFQKEKKAPEYLYRVLFSYNAKRGDIKETKRLYVDYKRRGYVISPKIYTSLFTACAKCQRRDSALELANDIVEFMRKKRFKPNIVVYNAMLMAYGRHHDFKTSLQIFDEVSQGKNRITAEAYSFLLDACLSDKNSGLRFALLIWHHMIRSSIKPNSYSFEALLCCIKNCSVGDQEMTMFEGAENMLNVTGNPGTDSGEGSEICAISAPEKSCTDIAIPEQINLVQKSHISDLFFKSRNFSSPVDRFLRIGGINGVLSALNHYNIKPNVKMFAIILECLPSTTEAEEELRQHMSHNKIAIDTVFLNVLLKRRLARGDLTSVQDCANLFHECKVRMDQVTLGTIAVVCDTRESCAECIALGRKFRIRLNEHIVGTLMYNARKSNDLYYVTDVITAVKEDNVRVGDKFIVDLKEIVSAKSNG